MFSTAFNCSLFAKKTTKSSFSNTKFDLGIIIFLTVLQRAFYPKFRGEFTLLIKDPLSNEGNKVPGLGNAGTEGIFWAEYERRLRLPKPNVDLLLSDPLAANSTRRETIPLHRQINAILSELEGVVTLHEWPEGETLLEALSCSRLWSVRRALSVIDEDQVTRLAAMLGVPERQACTTFEFDPDFIEVLREQFMLPLECSELFPYKDVLTNYKTSLDVGVVEAV